jgi:DNA-binding Lrp family transcriptional regulator
MVTAIVLIKAETNRIPDLANQIAETPGISEVFSVAGRYDLVETETMIAFRAYSKQELEAGFELGLD